MGTIADQLTHEIRLARKADFLPKILVIDFLNQEGDVTALGDKLAEQLSGALVERIGPEDVVTRRQFREQLLAAGISPVDLQELGPARWNAWKAGANVIVFGKVLSSKQKTTLEVELVKVSSGKRLAKATTDLSLTEEMKGLFEKPLDWPATPGVVGPCFQPGEVPATRRAAGVIEPKCLHCPVPSYNDEARKAGYEGSVRVKVVVDEEGRAQSEIIILGAPYGLDAQAVKAIKEWRFAPARKDGKPVSTCAVVEMTFRRF